MCTCHQPAVFSFLITQMELVHVATEVLQRVVGRGQRENGKICLRLCSVSVFHLYGVGQVRT